MEEGKVNLKEKKSEIKIFMEYVPGGSIKDLIKLFKTFSE
jgi:serine/threonine protein kinase